MVYHQILGESEDETMIEITNTTISGWLGSIRGMRNPKNSWERSDSHECSEELAECGECPMVLNGHDTDKCHSGEWGFCVGKNDHDLMMRLAAGGAVHAKHRRFITVIVDINAPLYWWKEFKTYRKDRKFLDDEDLPFDGDADDMFMDAEKIEGNIEMNSCSTMHKIHAKEFSWDDFSHEHLLRSQSINDECLSTLLEIDGSETRYKVSPNGLLSLTIDCLNNYRKKFIETKDKLWWWQMIQLLPSSYNQRRTVLLNYEVLHEMYKWRRSHKLDEWVTFCKWIESLPYSEIITGGKHERESV